MELDTEYAHYEMEDNMVIVTFKNITITEFIAKKIVNDRKDFTKGILMPGLADVRKMKDVDRTARTFFQSDESKVGLCAVALLTDSVFTTYIANFFLKVSYKTNRTLPSRVFTNKEKALDWLKKYVK